MKEVFDSIIDKLEDLHAKYINQYGIVGSNPGAMAVSRCIRTVEEVQEEYNDGWIPCSKQLPPHSDDLLLIQCSGKPKNNIVFDNGFCLASYTKEGWLLELYPEWKGAEVIAWMPLPAPYQPKGE